MEVCIVDVTKGRGCRPLWLRTRAGGIQSETEQAESVENTLKWRGGFKKDS